MSLDIRLLAQEHFLLFALSFIALQLLLTVVWQGRIKWLQASSHIYYAGIFLAVVVSILAFFQLSLPLALGLLVATMLIVILGRYDEISPLTPATQFMWQVIIAAVVIVCGWNIIQITHLGGEGVISLAWFTVGPWLMPASLITLVWLLFLMNAINWLDGVDGLAGSVVVVAFATLAGISLLPATQDNLTLSLSLIGLGSVVAFLLWNWSPARMYLGTSGSWFLGLYLGLVALIGGGKIATTVLVLAIPLIDVLLVILQRVFNKQFPWRGDRTWHLHFHLLNAGVSPRFIVVLAIIISSLAGLAAVTLQTVQKVSVFLLIAAVLATGVGLLLHHKWRSSKKV